MDAARSVVIGATDTLRAFGGGCTRSRSALATRTASVLLRASGDGAGVGAAVSSGVALGCEGEQATARQRASAIPQIFISSVLTPLSIGRFNHVPHRCGPERFVRPRLELVGQQLAYGA